MSDVPLDPRLPGWWRQLGLSLDDFAERVPFPEAHELVNVGRDCHGRDAWLAPGAAQAWTRLREAAGQDGLDLLLVSAFRSYEKQVRLWEMKRGVGEAPAAISRVLAIPGFSQHHTGRAIDLGAPGCTELTERFETTAEFRWLTAHAADFAFSMPFGRNNPAGVIYEPWHWFWNGDG